MNKVGVCEWCLPVYGPFAVDFAADCGFEGIQLTDLRGPYRGFPMTNKCIQEGYKEASARTGVELASMHLQTLSHTTGQVCAADSPKGQMARLQLAKGIEGCVAMGIHSINVSGGNIGGMGGSPIIKEAWDNLVEFLTLGVKSCADNGITLAYESCMPIVHLKVLMDAVPGLTVNYDIDNSTFVGTGFEIPLNIPDRIDHVHIKDTLIDKVTGKRKFVITGKGEGKVAEAIKLLNEKGYEGWYYSESKYIQYLLPEDMVLGNYGSKDFGEMSIDDELFPRSFGLGDDMTLVISTDCAAIKSLVR